MSKELNENEVLILMRKSVTRSTLWFSSLPVLKGGVIQSKSSYVKKGFEILNLRSIYVPYLLM